MSVVIFLAASLSGCAAAPKKYPVIIVGGETVRGSVIVDVVGVTPAELRDWESYSVSKYFEPSNPKRRDADKVSFKITKGYQYTLPITDAMWSRWEKRGVSHLMVLADLPNIQEDPPRRVPLSLFPRDWVKTKQLELEILESGVRILTKQRVAK